MSILGHRVLRKEDSRFLLGAGDYIENKQLESALSVTFVRSLVAHARIDGVDASAARELPGVQVFTGADVDAGPWGPPPLPGLEKGMGRPLVAQDVVRFVGDIVAIVVSEDAVTGADAAELVYVDYDPLPVVVAPGDAAKDETLLFPDVGTNVAARRRLARLRRELLRRLRGDRLGHARQSAHGSVPAGATFGRRRGGRRRPRHRLALDADAAPGPLRARGNARRRPGSDPRRRARRRRRVRRQDAGRRGDPRRLARAPPRTGCPLDRVPQREHGRARPRPGAGGALHPRRDARRQGARLPARSAPGLRRLPGARCLPAAPDAPDGERRVRDPEDRVLERVGGHEHDADDRLPRRRPTRGDTDDRACARRLRLRDRHGSGGGAPRELHRRRVPAQDRLGGDVRLGRLRGRARPGAAGGGLRRAPRRADAAPRGRRGEAARDRRQLLRRGDERDRRDRVRRRRDHAGRRRDRPHRARSRTARATRRRSR